MRPCSLTAGLGNTVVTIDAPLFSVKGGSQTHVARENLFWPAIKWQKHYCWTGSKYIALKPVSPDTTEMMPWIFIIGTRLEELFLLLPRDMRPAGKDVLVKDTPGSRNHIMHPREADVKVCTGVHYLAKELVGIINYSFASRRRYVRLDLPEIKTPSFQKSQWWADPVFTACIQFKQEKDVDLKNLVPLSFGQPLCRWNLEPKFVKMLAKNFGVTKLSQLNDEGLQIRLKAMFLVTRLLAGHVREGNTRRTVDSLGRHSKFFCSNERECRNCGVFSAIRLTSG